METSLLYESSSCSFRLLTSSSWPQYTQAGVPPARTDSCGCSRSSCRWAAGTSGRRWTARRWTDSGIRGRCLVHLQEQQETQPSSSHTRFITKYLLQKKLNDNNSLFTYYRQEVTHGPQPLESSHLVKHHKCSWSEQQPLVADGRHLWSMATTFFSFARGIIFCAQYHNRRWRRRFNLENRASRVLCH